MSGTHMRKVGCAALKAICPGRSGRACPTTLLALQPGPSADPFVTVPALIAQHWAERAWSGNLPNRALIDHWLHHGRRMVEKAKRVGNVKGPFMALIHHLTRQPMRVRW